jgi:hypothetical protein
MTNYVLSGECETNSYVVHIAGNYSVALDFTNKYTFEHGACAQMCKVDFCYTGGQEAGITARFINYPRFPKDDIQIHEEVLEYAKGLAARLYQKSFSIEGLQKTYYYTSDNPLHKK